MITTLDLSSITDRLIALITDARDNSPMWTLNGGSVSQFTIAISGSMPETVRNLGDCQLSVYLMHVAPDKQNRNLAGPGLRPQPNTGQPIALDLYYLITAYAARESTQEQQAISIVLKALHEHSTFVDPLDGFTFTITLEPETPEEANRRWQSYSTPFRLSAVYRVSVIFVTPVAPAPAPAPPPREMGLAVAPTSLPLTKSGQVLGTSSRVVFTPPLPTPDDSIGTVLTPAVAVPGMPFTLVGSALDLPTAARVYLIEPGNIEREITAWKAASGNTASRVILNLPANIGVAPAGSPEPGVYQLRVGSDTVTGDATTMRSNSTPFSIAPRIDVVASPIAPAAGVFSLTGAGFIVGQTELLLDTIALSAIAQGGVPADGEFAINFANNGLSFRLPANLTTGRYFVRVRVRSIEAPMIGWVDVP